MSGYSLMARLCVILCSLVATVQVYVNGDVDSDVDSLMAIYTIVTVLVSCSDNVSLCSLMYGYILLSPMCIIY